MKLKKSDEQLITGLIESFLGESDTLRETINEAGIKRLIELRTQEASEVIFNGPNKSWMKTEQVRLFEKVKPSFPHLAE
ncbi:MAG: hypothetical protein R2824_15760 [Saprospiraceae bacterium]|nr:hypothetical protein [Lewinella sp.]